jgi:AcrR family transcriptional regulator
MSKPGLRERKNAEVKRALFRAAMELFRSNGYEQTSVDEIAQRAGFSRATFFNHFGTKRGVLRYYGQHLAARITQLLDATDAGVSPLQRIRDVLFTMAGEADRHREDLKLIYTHSMRDPDYLRGPTSARKQVFETLCGLVAEAQDIEEVRQDVPAPEIALVFLSAYQGAVTAAVFGFAPARDVLSSAWLCVVDGVRGESSSAR